MNILFYPSVPNKNDTYCGRLILYLMEEKHNVYFIEDIKKDFSLINKFDIATFNFFENIGDRPHLKSFVAAMKKLVFLIILKILGTRIYFTFNNKVPHDDRHNIYGLFLIKFQMKICDKILLLCRNSKKIADEYIGKKAADRKCYYLGAPLVEQNCEEWYHQKHTEVNYLFFGSIRTYKNIELLVDVWKDLKLTDAMLTIVGKPYNDKYGKLLFECCKNIDNINLCMEFVNDAELNRLLINSDVVVEAFDLISGINSATLLRTAALDKTMIISRIPLVYDFGEELLFCYEYTDIQSHRKALKKQIKKAYKMCREYPEKVEHMGRKLHERIADIDSEDKVRRRYSVLFQENKK